MKQWPNVYYFGTPIGPVFKWFAWHPVRTWWGKWVWLETVQVARIAKIDHLDGPDWAFWSYEKVGPVQECTDQDLIKKPVYMGQTMAECDCPREEACEVAGRCLALNEPCRKCGGQMEPGHALEQTFTAGAPDFAGSDIVTISAGGPGRMVTCRKCKSCGWSVRA